MKVYSNIITRATVGTAVNESPATFQNTHSLEGWFEPIREFTPRGGGNGFEFFLSGSSPYRAQHDREEFAATWDEWGIVIDALYFVDPNARIGHYKNRADFFAQTQDALESNARYESVGGRKRTGMTAPWLD